MIVEKIYNIDVPEQNVIIICVTEECNLRCRYCYMVGKNNFSKMDFDTAKKIIDFVLENRDVFNKNRVIFDFIGGEPFLAIDLLNDITSYLKKSMKEKQHPWNNNYLIRILTNGVNYNLPKVQKYIQENSANLAVGFSIDGNKQKHDSQRVFENGDGSYELIIKNVPLWLSQFPNSYAKATFSHDDLRFLKDSIVNLWSLGIKDISANIVFENVWDENDPIVFEQQLMDLADYVIANNLVARGGYNVKFFNPNLCKPLDINLLDKPYCPAGIDEFAFDCKGDIFPCIRFLDFSLNNKKGFSLGNVFRDLDRAKLEIFLKLGRSKVDPEECLNCNVRSGCATCLALNYDESEKPLGDFKRTTHTCNMHKANVRAAKYFYNQLDELEIIKH